MKRARLFCKTGQLAGASFDIAGEASIGKSAGNTIQLYPTLISGQHARITFDEKANSYFIEDLGSRNGTRLDALRIRGKERLGNLHVITFANTFDFFFQILEGEQKSEQSKVKPPQQKPDAPVEKAKPASPAVKPPDRGKTIVSDDFASLPQLSSEDERGKTVFDDAVVVPPNIRENEKADEQQAKRTKVGVEFTPVPSFVEPSKPPQPGTQSSSDSPKYVLVFESLKGGAKAFDIREGSMTVGREASCEIAVDDGSVSRKHAEFTFKNGKLTLKDLSSKNHTYIDDRRISSEVEVHEGMEITFGLLKAKLVRKPAK